jgi:hypothetical protein
MMRIYTVHEPAAGGVKPEDPSSVIFIREGFSWMAFIAPLLWLFYHRMWLVAAAYLGLSMMLGLLAQAEGGSQLLSGLVGLGFSLIVAFEAFEIRRWHLRRKGFRQVASIAAKNLDLAEMRYFTKNTDDALSATPGRETGAHPLPPLPPASPPLRGQATETGWGFTTRGGRL